jgi:phosphate transport system permease protein
MVDRRKADLIFKRLVTLVSGFSILALGAILVFVLVRGVAPFVLPTDSGMRIVTEGIDEISVNGQVYRDTVMIPVPRDTSSLILVFPGRDGEHRALIDVSASERDPERMIRFTADEDAAISSPEAYVYTLAYSGTLPGLKQKIHLILPEPPYGLHRFLGGMDWRPTYTKVYGIFPMIIGTILAGFGAVLLGVPPALLCALFLGEFLHPRAASIARGGIELLAGIPSVVYGFFGLMVVVPAVKGIFNVPSGNGLLSAVIILALMILPTVIAIAETAIRAVPRSHREASLSLGASKMQTAWFVVMPHARSGILTGIILGISRAMGETMAVILVAGNSAQLVHSPLDSVRTLTATIALEMGYAQGRHSEMLFSVGVVLFAIILLLNSAILKVRRLTDSEA